MAELEPRWVVSVRDWWQQLLGPLLTTMVDEVRRKAGNSALAEKAYGGTVRRFEAELAALEADVTAFQAQALGSEWSPYADRAAEIMTNLKGQWLDPAATQPLEGGVAGVASVLRGINVAVTAIGIAWAAVSICEVLRARKLLRSWSADLSEGVHPTKRTAKRAGLAGEVVGRRRFRRRRPHRRRRRRMHRAGPMLPPGVELDEPDFDEGLPPDGPPWRFSLPGG